MARRQATLLAQIEKEALDDSAPLATALRKCVVLGGKSGSEQLRDWATRELQGYHGKDDLPDYRVVGAPLQVDGVSGNYQITGQQIPPSELPNFAQEHISEEVKLLQGVGGLEALARQSDIKLMPPMGGDLVRIMNSESDNPFQHIHRIYWSVAPSALHGVLDHIRTALTQLIAELQANMDSDEEIPSTEAANQAVNVVVTGERSQVKVTTAQSSGADNTAVAVPREALSSPSESAFWTRSRRIGAFAVGAATIVAAVVAVMQL
jgi:AbiTii